MALAPHPGQYRPGVGTMLKTPDDEVDDHLRALAEMADASGGGITDPPQTVWDCPDWEDRGPGVAAAQGEDSQPAGPAGHAAPYLPCGRDHGHRGDHGAGDLLRTPARPAPARAAGEECCCRYPFTQNPSVVSFTPSSRATWAIGLEKLTTILAASSLNSGEYLLGFLLPATYPPVLSGEDPIGSLSGNSGAPQW